jgi:hypothetical protein
MIKYTNQNRDIICISILSYILVRADRHIISFLLFRTNFGIYTYRIIILIAHRLVSFLNRFLDDLVCRLDRRRRSASLRLKLHLPLLAHHVRTRGIRMHLLLHRVALLPHFSVVLMLAKFATQNLAQKPKIRKNLTDL